MKIGCILILILFSVLINLFSFNHVQDWGDDFAAYVLQAKAVHTGDYRVLETNIRENNLTLNFPWGFPILISPLINYFDSNIIVIKIFTYLFFLLALVVIFLLLRADREVALLTVLFLSSSPYFWEFKNYILSDLPNLFFVLLTLYIANRFVTKQATIISDYFTCLIIGMLIFISFMMRNQSLVLLPAIMLAQAVMLRRGLFSIKNLTILFIPAATFLILSSLTPLFIPLKSIPYIDHYSVAHLGKNISENILYYSVTWKDLFSTTLVINHFPAAFTVFFMAMALTGAISGAKKNMLFIVFFVLSMVLLLVSPYQQGARYLIPIVPFLFYFFILGLRFLVYRRSKENLSGDLAYYSVVGAIILLSVITIFTYSYESFVSPPEWAGPYKKTSVDMFDFIRNNSSKDQTIGFYKPKAMLLYTGRNSALAFSYELCLIRKVDYFVYYKKTVLGQLTLESIKNHADHFGEVYRNEDFIVFKVKRQKV